MGGVETGEDASADVLDEGEVLFGVNGTDLVVPVLAAFQPQVPNLGFFPGQRVGQVVEDTEILVKVTQFIVVPPPHQSVPTQFELFLTRLVDQIWLGDDLFARDATVMP